MIFATARWRRAEIDVYVLWLACVLMLLMRTLWTPFTNSLPDRICLITLTWITELLVELIRVTRAAALSIALRSGSQFSGGTGEPLKNYIGFNSKNSAKVNEKYAGIPCFTHHDDGYLDISIVDDQRQSCGGDEDVRLSSFDSVSGITFQHQKVLIHRTGDEHDHIVSHWFPRRSADERRCMDAYAKAADLTHLPAQIDATYNRLRDRRETGERLSAIIDGDHISLCSRRAGIGLQAMVAAASMSGVPADAVSFLTIDAAATPSMPIWQLHGGASYRDLLLDCDTRIVKALRSAGGVHVFMERFTEIAARTPAPGKDYGYFIRDWQKANWPASLSGYTGTVFMAHHHMVLIVLDDAGQPVSRETIRKALTEQFPARRAVHLEALRVKDGKNLGGAAKNAILYALKRIGEATTEEIQEHARWASAFDETRQIANGWTSFSAAPPRSAMIMVRSLMGREQFRDDCHEIDLGPERYVVVDGAMADVLGGSTACLSRTRPTLQSAASRPFSPLSSTSAAEPTFAAARFEHGAANDNEDRGQRDGPDERIAA